MRNRTEAVTNNLAESDNEEEQSVDDSEEDWKPEKKKGAKGGKRKSAGPASKRGSKRSKKDESSEEEEEDQEDEEEEDESEQEESEEDEELSDDGASTKGKKSNSANKKRASISVGKNQPDKDGNMELYLFKNDLTKEFRSDEKLCMWRRDGASLLQKYMVVSDETLNKKEIVFKASSVYSCWEEKRKNDFFQIKVQIIGDKKEGKVKVVNVDEFEKYSTEDRPKVDITPKGAEGGENNDDDDEEDEIEDEENFDEDEE